MLETALQETRGRESADAAAQHGEASWTSILARDQKVARHIDCERGSAPRERHAPAAVPVVVDEQFVAEALRLDYETARTVWSESDDLANDPIARHLYWCEVTFVLKAET